jgi:polyferredoxin
MDKMGYPRGLVRYDTQNGLAQHLTTRQKVARVLRPRVLVYSSVLLMILAGMLVSLSLRTTFKVDVVRDRASLARIVDDGRVENVYRLQIMNATEKAHRFVVVTEGLPGLMLADKAEVKLAPAEARWVTLGVQLPPQTAQQVGPGAHAIRFRIDRLPEPEESGAAASVTEKSTFMVPR